MPQPDAVADRAEARFTEGFNCAQAVLGAAADAAGFRCAACIPAVALAMGGGIGHTGRACGALSGAVMAVGLGVDRALGGPIAARKDEANRRAGALVRAFAAEFGSTDCAAILGFSWEAPDALDRYRRDDAKRARCAPCVRWAAAEAARVLDSLGPA